MNTSAVRDSFSGRCQVWTLLVFFAVQLSVCAQAQIEGYGLTNRLDGIALLAPPPVEGSSEYKADLEAIRFVFKNRTAAEEALAMKYAQLTVFNFKPVIGEFFEPGKLVVTAAFFEKIKPAIKPAIFGPKEHFNRTRPYEVDKTLNLGEPESSASYPSGHSAVGMIQALLLAEIFPEKRQELLAVGREIGWARVVIGKHFPTDVQAGRVLAQAIVRELLQSPQLQRDLDEVKAEIHKMRSNRESIPLNR